MIQPAHEFPDYFSRFQRKPHCRHFFCVDEYPKGNAVKNRLRSCAAPLKYTEGKEVVVACWIAGARNAGIERGVTNASMILDVLR